MRQLNADALERPAPPRATGRKAQSRQAAARPSATRQPAARQPAARQAVRRRPAPRWRRFAWRAGAILVLLLVVAGGAAWLWRAGIPSSVYARTKDRLLLASADAGYRLR